MQRARERNAGVPFGTLLALAGFRPDTPDHATRTLYHHRNTTMTGRLFISRWVLLSVTAALAACGGGGEHRVADRGAGSGTVATRGDSAAGSVEAMPVAQAKSDSSFGPPNHMGRIPVLEYHVIGDTQSLYQQRRETFRQNMETLNARE